MEKELLLHVDSLRVAFHSAEGPNIAVNEISFSVFRGEKLGIVGESGSGKTVTSYSILRLLENQTSNKTQGAIIYKNSDEEVDLLTLPSEKLRRIRGRKISIVFQEPMSSLNPVLKCGRQVKEIMDVHNIRQSDERKKYILDLFSALALPEPKRIYNSYPHELSGGQLQRVNIAMALATEPDIIICDEPTTALDVTVQAQILDLLEMCVEKFNVALIFISHDLDVIASLCDRVLVMYKGDIVEEGELPETFSSPRHKYTQALLQCKPNRENKELQLPTVQSILNGQYKPQKRNEINVDSGLPVIRVNDLKVHFSSGGGMFFGKKTTVKAVDGVSFELFKNEILGIVGESGSGKSTVAYSLSGLVQPTAGEMYYGNRTISSEEYKTDSDLRRNIQLVFQNPYASLNPQLSIGSAVMEPMIFHKLCEKSHAKREMLRLLDQVGLDESFAKRYPHQLSGGQRQRVCIARALSLKPEVLICDESVSALDVSVQAQILNLLNNLREEYGLSLIFISHDLAVVHYLCDRILVMRSGHIVEKGTSDQVMQDPQMEYTKRLIDSIPGNFQLR